MRFHSYHHVHQLFQLYAINTQVSSHEIDSNRRCRMRMAMDRQDEMSGFVGGLA